MIDTKGRKAHQNTKKKKKITREWCHQDGNIDHPDFSSPYKNTIPTVHKQNIILKIPEQGVTLMHNLGQQTLKKTT